MGRPARLAQRRVEGAAQARDLHTRQAPVIDRRLPRTVGATAEPTPEPHIEVERPGELLGVDCFSSYAWAELVRCPDGVIKQAQTSRLVQRVARDLRQAGWKLERILTDNGNEFQRPTFTDTVRALKADHRRIHAGRPQSNGHVERLHRTILEECWRPAFARYRYLRYRGLQRELLNYLNYYNHQRGHTGTHHPRRSPSGPRLRCPQNEAKMSRTRRHIPESVQIWALAAVVG